MQPEANIGEVLSNENSIGFFILLLCFTEFHKIALSIFSCKPSFFLKVNFKTSLIYLLICGKISKLFNLDYSC